MGCPIEFAKKVDALGGDGCGNRIVWIVANLFCFGGGDGL